MLLQSLWNGHCAACQGVLHGREDKLEWLSLPTYEEWTDIIQTLMLIQSLLGNTASIYRPLGSAMTSGVEVPTESKIIHTTDLWIPSFINPITLLLIKLPTRWCCQRKKLHSANIEFLMNELSSNEYILCSSLNYNIPFQFHCPQKMMTLQMKGSL